jgi:hypothetical protein
MPSFDVRVHVGVAIVEARSLDEGSRIPGSHFLGWSSALAKSGVCLCFGQGIAASTFQKLPSIEDILAGEIGPMYNRKNSYKGLHLDVLQISSQHYRSSRPGRSCAQRCRTHGIPAIRTGPTFSHDSLLGLPRRKCCPYPGCEQGSAPY